MNAAAAIVQIATDRFVGRRSITIPITPTQTASSVRAAPTRLRDRQPLQDRFSFNIGGLCEDWEPIQPGFPAIFPDWVGLATPVKKNGHKSVVPGQSSELKRVWLCETRQRRTGRIKNRSFADFAIHRTVQHCLGRGPGADNGNQPSLRLELAEELVGNGVA